MKKSRIIIKVIVYSIVLLVLSILNVFLKIIAIPDVDIIVDRELNFITISTVFVGFAFTSLGILLGMSSEKLIQKIQGTTIIQDKVSTIVKSIVFLMISILTGMYFVIGLNDFLLRCFPNSANSIQSVVYGFSLEALIVGIIYFAVSTRDLYDLINRTYDFNKNKKNMETIEKARQQLEKNGEKLKKANFEE